MKKLILNILLWLGSLIVFNLIPLIALPFNIIYYSVKGELADYFLNLAIGEDQKAGSYLYKTEDWTISAYTYYLGVVKNYKTAWIFMKIIDLVPYLSGYKNHCKRAYFKEKPITKQ